MSHPIRCVLLSLVMGSGLAAPIGAQRNRPTQPPPGDSTWTDEARRAGNAEEFRTLKAVDSALAEKVRENRPEIPRAEREQERARRKEAMLAEFCTERRFKRRAEVDSLPRATVEEREACKRRLLVLNPLIP